VEYIWKTAGRRSYVKSCFGKCKKKLFNKAHQP